MSSILIQQTASAYLIQTEVYSGPLDLLLQLIERQELDISQLSLAKVTDQYLQHLKIIEQQDPIEVSSFLVIAAQLVLIKSKILLPKYVTESEEVDTGQELVDRLLVYKKYKDISVWLKNREEKGLRSYNRLSSTPITIEKIDFSSITIQNLIQLVINMMLLKKDFENINTVVTISTTTIEQRIDNIISFLRERKKAYFQDLINSDRSRLQIVITFLALLELIKHHLLQAQQEQIFDKITLEYFEEFDRDFEIEL